MTNLQLLQQFSRVTGIKDQRTEMIVAGYDIDLFNCASSFGTVTTANVSSQAVTLDIDAISDMFDKMHSDICKAYRPLYPWRFDVFTSKTKWWGRMTFDDIPEFMRPDWWGNDDEVRETTDWREWYERELELRDILPKDGWIPKED